MKPTFLIFLFSLVSIVGCSGKSEYEVFQERLEEGSGCEELFTLRNSFDPSLPDIGRMNRDLREVGCHTSSSVRSLDTVSGERNAPLGSVSEQQFTVKEYRMYRALMDTPMSVSEDQALEVIAEENGVTVAEANSVTGKVQIILFQNKWFGSPESEIKYASDWNTEDQ